MNYFIDEISIYRWLWFLSGGGCSLIKCSKYAVCHNSPDGTPTCVCPKKEGCPASVKPVCGSDGKTYINECLMKVIACEANKDTDKRRDGLCGKTLQRFWLLCCTSIAHAGDTEIWANIVSAFTKNCSRWRFSRWKMRGAQKPEVWIHHSRNYRGMCETSRCIDFWNRLPGNAIECFWMQFKGVNNLENILCQSSGIFWHAHAQQLATSIMWFSGAYRLPAFCVVHSTRFFHSFPPLLPPLPPLLMILSPLIFFSVTAACLFPFVWGLLPELRCCASHGGVISI